MKIKGAFKNFPPEQRPVRIPVSVYDELAECVAERISKKFHSFVPSIKKTNGREDAGDLDVFLDPINRQTWRDDLRAIFAENIVAELSNGPQQMFVMEGLIDDKKYMIDFILAEEGSFDYRKKYSKFGTIIPAVVGSFARSLLYKFDQNKFSLRLISKKGNFHNIPLTRDFDTALKILMLDPRPFYEDRLYSAEEVAAWIIASPRFDSTEWHRPHSSKGQTITTKNKKSHRAIKIKPDVQKAYDIIDAVSKTATWDNYGYKIERKLLGDSFVDGVIKSADEIEKKDLNSVSGEDVMEILGIPSGPEVGIALKSVAGLSREDGLKKLKNYHNCH